MFKNILTANQLKLLPLVREFSRDYYLVGGTAIALHLGHRRSIDFDLFTSGRLKKQSIKRTIGRHTDASRLFLYKVTLNLMQGAVPIFPTFI